MGRYHYSGLADHFPQFEVLLGAVQARRCEFVFTDVVEILDPRETAHYNWIRYRLQDWSSG